MMSILGLASIGLILAHSVVLYLTIYKGIELRAMQLAFHLDLEGNIPTVFSTLLLFFIGVLCLLVYTHERNEGGKDRFWLILALIFTFLAFDEGGQLHEKLINPFRGSMGNAEGEHGILYFAWVIPYGVICLVVGVVLFKSWLKLPAKTKYSFLISGMVYLTGAIGMELIGGVIVEDLGFADPLYAGIVTIEESIEILGILLFTYTLLDHLRSRVRSIPIEFY